MNLKIVSVSGIVGAIVNFLLGWLFYGILFMDSFKQPEESSTNMLLIFVACLVFAAFIAYIFDKWAQISTAATGAKAGAVIGFFLGLNYNIWAVIMEGREMQPFLLDVVLSIVITAITGAVIALVIGKMSSKS